MFGYFDSGFEMFLVKVLLMVFDDVKMFCFGEWCQNFVFGVVSSIKILIGLVMGIFIDFFEELEEIKVDFGKVFGQVKF